MGGGIPRLALMNRTSNQPVTSDGSTPVELIGPNSSTPTYIAQELPLQNSLFPDLTDYSASIRSGDGTMNASLYRAGIWLTLDNLTQSENYFRLGIGEFINANSSAQDVRSGLQRMTSPVGSSSDYVFALENRGYRTGSGTVQIALTACGLDDEYASSCTDQSPTIAFAASNGSITSIRSADITALSGVGLGTRLLIRHQVPFGNEWNSFYTFLIGKVSKY